MPQCNSGAAEWNEVSPTGPVPPPRALHTMTSIEGGGFAAQWLVAGGVGEAGTLPNTAVDTWILRKHGESSYEWVTLEPAGRVPVDRHSHAAHWDADDETLYLYGGVETEPNLGPLESERQRTDFWKLDLSELPDAPVR